MDLDLNQDSYVKALVYNIKGQEIYSIYDGYLTQGYKMLNWKADNSSSGIYFINIEVDGVTISSQKVSLLK